MVSRIITGRFALDMNYSKRAGVFLIILGIVLNFLGVLLLVAGLFASLWLVQMGLEEGWSGVLIALSAVATPGILFAGIGIMSRANFIFRVSLRHFSKIVTSPQDVDYPYFTVYLRSFADDEGLAEIQRLPGLSGAVRALYSTGQTEEEQLAAALRPMGPMVGIGCPGERVPHTGARRLYLPLENWKDPVRELMLRARLVVIALGPGAGVMWELAEAMRILPPERLRLIVPMEYDEYEVFRNDAAVALRARAEQELRDTGEHWLPPHLPDYASRREISSRIQGLIFFSSDWTPVFLPLRPSSPFSSFLRHSLDRAILPVVTQLDKFERSTTDVQGKSDGQVSPPSTIMRRGWLYGRSMASIRRHWANGALPSVLGMAIIFAWMGLGQSKSWAWAVLLISIALSFSYGRQRRMIIQLWSTGLLQTAVGVGIQVGLFGWLASGRDVSWALIILLLVVGGISFTSGQNRRR